MVPVLPSRFDEHASQMGVAGFGDRALDPFGPAGILGGDQAGEGHQTRGRRKAAGVAEFGGKGQRREVVDAAEAAEAFDPRLQRLDREHDNLRAALRRTLDVGDSGLALRMAGALGWFWIVRGNRTEALHWLESVLSITGNSAGPDPSRARCLVWAAKLSGAQGDADHAVDLFERALSDVRELGDRRGGAWVLSDFGELERERGNYDRANAMLAESLTIRREIGDRTGIAASLNNLGLVASAQGDYASARAYYEESLTISRDVGEKWVGWIYDLRSASSWVHFHNAASKAARRTT